jgi:hypothetical protein
MLIMRRALKLVVGMPEKLLELENLSLKGELGKSVH